MACGVILPAILFVGIGLDSNDKTDHSDGAGDLNRNQWLVW